MIAAAGGIVIEVVEAVEAAAAAGHFVAVVSVLNGNIDDVESDVLSGDYTTDVSGL